MSHRYNTRFQAKKAHSTPIPDVQVPQPQSQPQPQPLTPIQEQQKQKDIAFIHEILERVANTKKERMLNVIELFQYLVWNPTMLGYSQFRAVTQRKIKEFEQNSVNERALLKLIINNRDLYSTDYSFAVAQYVGWFDCVDSLSKKLKNIIETY